MLRDLTAFLIAFLGSLTLTIPIRRLALRIGMVDKPNPRKIHRNPIPLLGGLAMYSGVVLALLVTLHRAVEIQTISILGGATLVAIVGILDDRGLLHHQIKLFGAMPAAAVFLLSSGIYTRVFPGMIASALPAMILDIGLSFFWIVGITAAFSILDHMDGLCAGVAAIAAFFFAVAAGLDGQFLVRTLAVATFGAALGFLCWNFNPAKIFMGDGGAMFLGILMAALGLKIHRGTSGLPMSVVVPVLILAVPIFDTLLVSVSRARRGLLPFASPGKDHTAHRLFNLGLGHRGAVLSIYGIGVIAGSAALFVPFLSRWACWLLAGVAGAMVLIAVFLLESTPFEKQGSLQKGPSVS